MPKLLLLLLLFTLCTPLNAQNRTADVAFNAKLSKSQMLVNSTVEFSLTLSNAQGTELKPPAFRNFIVLNGPNRAMRTTLINGVATSAQSFTWLLRPKREGQLVVEPATIRALGRTYRSNSQRVTVLPANTSPGDLQPKHFLKAEVSTREAYVGQQVILNLNLYTSDNVVSRNIMREPDFDGFYSQPRRQFDGRPRPTVENGREYEVRTLGSIALFPSKVGRLVITPYDMIIGVVRYRNVGGTSRRRFMEQIALTTDTVYIDVQELPRPQPQDFSGGVGIYRLDATTDKDQMTTDEAITMRITIVGEGDIKRISPFDPVDRRDWEVYDPRVLQEELLDSPSGIMGRKILEYKLVPKRGGDYVLEPTMVYYNVERQAYVSLAPETFKVKVSGGTGTPNYEIDSSAVKEEVLDLIRVDELSPGRQYGNNPSNRLSYWLLFLLPLLLAAAAIAYQRYGEHLDNRDPVELARERAAKAATERLREAETHLRAVTPRPFYDAVEGALLGYLRDRLNVPVSELNRSNITKRLTAVGATSLTDRYDELLQRCEMALYAGQDKADDLTDTYRQAKELIIDTEKAIKAEAS